MSSGHLVPQCFIDDLYECIECGAAEASLRRKWRSRQDNWRWRLFMRLFGIKRVAPYVPEADWFYASRDEDKGIAIQQCGVFVHA